MNKPVILLGNGVRNNPALIEHLCSLNIPILTTWMAADLLPEDSPVFCGRPGIFGQRAANIIQQKATHLYCFGARLDGEQVAYDYDRFAPNAEIWVYDVDAAELNKLPERFYTIEADVARIGGNINAEDGKWLAWCKALYKYFRLELDGEQRGKYVNPFYFLHLLSDMAESDDVFALGSSGNAPTTFYQAFKVKHGQRISNVSTIGAMGADVPMALGAALSTGRRTICITGDGGFQMNAQELETIRRLHLPIIFFVMNNGGYNSIRVGQLARFGRVTGANPASGFTMASIEKLADCYGFMYMKLDRHNLSDFQKCFTATPLIVEVMVDPEWQQLPRVMASGDPGNLVIDNMEDMSPKIPELAALMDKEDIGWFDWARLQ